jgi:hypothetical protein
MAAKVNDIVAGKYNHTGESIIYGDTDSVYFTAHKTLQNDINEGKIAWNKESVIALYDKIAEEMNTTFTGYMTKAFHCPNTRGSIIKAGRELVAIKGLFITKKRYAVLYYDREGERVDNAGNEGKVKAMGLDLKRSDTPVFVQDFLSEILYMVLTGKTEKQVLEAITNFRTKFKAKPGWEKGSPKRANNVTKYSELEKQKGKANMPGHVRASMNWNRCREMYGDKYSLHLFQFILALTCPGIFALPFCFSNSEYLVTLFALFGDPFSQPGFALNFVLKFVIASNTCFSVLPVNTIYSISLKKSCTNTGVSDLFKSSPMAFTLPSLPALSTRSPSLS